MPHRQMNILWIMADQMRADCAGFAGHPIVRTPNLDNLASRSAVFDNAFAAAPLCGPSRTCLFTGQYVHQHGVWWNGVPLRREGFLLPETLRRHGYHTRIVGKLHFAPPEKSFGFDHKQLHEECLLDGKGLDAYEQFLSEKGIVGGPGKQTEWLNRHSDLGICRMSEELEETYWVAHESCRFLRQRREKPFFLFASFIRPHSPYNPLPAYADIYADAKIEPPLFHPEQWENTPPRVAATAQSWGWDTLTPEDIVEVRRHYYGLCSQVDANVGRILQCLHEQGLDESTIVLFTSDHGDFLGEHGLLYKEHLYDAALRVPLLIHHPGRKAVRSQALVENIDIAPTLLDLVGIPTPPDLPARSLVPLLDKPQRIHRDVIFSEWTTHSINARTQMILDACRHQDIKTIRTERWKYIHYVDEPGELYDLQNDPEETRNLFSHPDMAQKLSELRFRLLDWLISTPEKPNPGKDNPYFEVLNR